MSEGDASDIEEAAKRIVTTHGARALGYVNTQISDVIKQRDAEGISWWREVAAVVRRLRA